MKKILLVIALVVSGMGLNAFNTNNDNLSAISILDEVVTDSIVTDSIVTDTVAVVATPANFTAEFDGFNTIVLKWDSVPNAYKYNIYRGSTLYVKVADVTFIASYLDFDTEYCFSVSGKLFHMLFQILLQKLQL